MGNSINALGAFEKINTQQNNGKPIFFKEEKREEKVGGKEERERAKERRQKASGKRRGKRKYIRLNSFSFSGKSSVLSSIPRGLGHGTDYMPSCITVTCTSFKPPPQPLLERKLIWEESCQRFSSTVPGFCAFTQEMQKRYRSFDYYNLKKSSPELKGKGTGSKLHNIQLNYTLTY